MSKKKEEIILKKAKTPKQKALRVCLYVSVAVMTLIILYPYLVMFSTALKSRAEIYAADGTIFPVVWLWENFTDIWSKAPLLRYFLNSVIVAGGSTMIAILCGIPAAYALARMKFKGQKFFLGLVIISQMFSPVVLLIGIYRVMSTLNMTDSLLGWFSSMQLSTRLLPSGSCAAPLSPSPRIWNRRPASTAATRCRL